MTRTLPEARPLPRGRRALVIAGLIVAIVGPGTAHTAPPAPLLADRIEVFKADRRLVLLREGKALATYRVSLGADPVGAKREEGDHRTPEGAYVIDFHKSDSAYHLALHISYPNDEDRRQAAQRGVSPGGAVMIHGLPNDLPGFLPIHRTHDWTDGCIAVTDREIEEIAAAVPDGTPIEIHP
jgi:murein L,D-transpeptidase YafK